MAKALWNDVMIAESQDTKTVEGNLYFPPESLKAEYFKKSDHQTVCGWKGTASYYDVVVDDKVNESAAWVYNDPKDAASDIKGYVAFWNGVEVQN